MRKLLVFLGLLASVAYCQSVRIQPDCMVQVTFTTAGSSYNLDNRATGCVAWTLAYTSTGFSVVSIEADTAPDANGTAGSFTVWPSGNVINGSLPLTDSSSAYAQMVGNYAWLRITANTLTGTGSVSATLYGWRQSSTRPALIGQLTTGHCVEAASAVTVQDSGGSCGGGGGGIVKSAQYATADQLTATGTFATTYTIPANTLKTGSLIEFWAAGPFNITTGEFLKFGLTIGSTTALPSAGQFVGTGTQNWNLIGRCIVITAGATGTAECEGHLIEGAGSSAPAAAVVADNTTFSIDTTASEAVSIPAVLTSGNGTANLSQLIVTVIP